MKSFATIITIKIILVQLFGAECVKNDSMVRYANRTEPKLNRTKTESNRNKAIQMNERLFKFNERKTFRICMIIA